MATESSTIITELLDAGFSRSTLVSVTGSDLREISAARMGRVTFHPKIYERLTGLLAWVKRMKSSKEFKVHPAAYYEVQMVVLAVDEGEVYTSFHQLYEAGIIDSEEMESLSTKFTSLYDYNAFLDQFPERADITLDGASEESEVVIHNGIAELQYDSEDQRSKAREAVQEILENDEQDRNSRRLA